MKNWTMEELKDYRKCVCKNLIKVYCMLMKRHSKEAKKITNDFKYTLLNELLKVNREISSRK